MALAASLLIASWHHGVDSPCPLQDHNVYIYYPQRMGGGSKRLFRKVGNESSRFYPDVNTIRRTGSYIYEEFMMTQGTDIKLYCVGKDYAHAEGERWAVRGDGVDVGIGVGGVLLLLWWWFEYIRGVVVVVVISSEITGGGRSCTTRLKGQGGA